MICEIWPPTGRPFGLYYNWSCGALAGTFPSQTLTLCNNLGRQTSKRSCTLRSCHSIVPVVHSLQTELYQPRRIYKERVKRRLFLIGRKVIRMSSPLHKLACRSLRIRKLRKLHNTGGNTYPTLQVASPAFVTVSDSQFKHLEIQTNKSEPEPEPHSSKRTEGAKCTQSSILKWPFCWWQVVEYVHCRLCNCIL